MNFLVYPPEVTSAQLFSGAGSEPMLATAAAWDGLAAELGSAAASFSNVTSGLAGSSWQGPASVAMTNAAAPYAGWLNTAANQAAGTAAQARVAASTFEAARGAAVHPTAVLANRTQLMSLVTSNLFGQNAPWIAATEAYYEQMWTQDVAAMAGYHAAASAVAGQLTSWSGALPRLAGIAAPLTAGPAAAAVTPASPFPPFPSIPGIVGDLINWVSAVVQWAFNIPFALLNWAYSWAVWAVNIPFALVHWAYSYVQSVIHWLLHLIPWI